MNPLKAGINLCTNVSELSIGVIMMQESLQGCLLTNLVS